MGLFDNLDSAPETPEKEIVLKNPTAPSLEAPEVTPETPEEVMMVARTFRQQAQEEEGMAFGNPVDLMESINNTIIGGLGASADMIAWAGRKAMTTAGASDETALKWFTNDSTAVLKNLTTKVGVGSYDESDTYMGHTGDGIAEGLLLLGGGAGLVQRTKQLSGVVGGISRNADKALKTKFGEVLAAETIAGAGAGMGRAYAEDKDFGATGSFLT